MLKLTKRTIEGMISFFTFKCFNLTQGSFGMVGLVLRTYHRNFHSYGSQCADKAHEKSKMSQEWPWVSRYDEACVGASPTVFQGSEASNEVSPYELIG